MEGIQRSENLLVSRLADLEPDKLPPKTWSSGKIYQLVRRWSINSNLNNTPPWGIQEDQSAKELRWDSGQSDWEIQRANRSHLTVYATSIVTIVPGKTLLITEMKKLWFSGRKLITISLEKHEIRICMGKVWHQFLSNSLWVCIIIECKSNINRNARNIRKHFE